VSGRAASGRRAAGAAALDDTLRLGGQGVFTLLFTDIEGSTFLWETYPDTMEDVVRAHYDLVVASVEGAGGRRLRFMGDGVVAIFTTAAAAVRAAVDAQRSLSDRSWPGIGELRVRMGLNTGWCHIVDGELFGRPPNLAARLESAGHGGQILLSDATAQACADALRADEHLFNLGRYNIRGFDQPVVVHSVVAEGLPAVFPPLRTPFRGFDELPADDAPLYGRDDLVDQVAGLLGDHREVTLWGPAGVGKTRVALRVARQARRPYDDGVRFVDLVSVDEPGKVAAAVAAALRAQPSAGEDHHGTVMRALHHSRVLLVLDNCEPVLDGVRDLVPPIAAECPHVRVLATSRELLGVPTECTIEVPTLPVPADGETRVGPAARSDAVRLFLDRARVVDPDLVLDARTVGPVVSLCRALDGLPLALELVAARLHVESVEALAADIPGVLGDIDGPARVDDDRPPAARAPLAWGLSGLAADEVGVYLRLGVFSGAFSREMALALASDLPGAGRAFDRLVRMSLVVRDRASGDRFRVLAVGRAHARALVPEADRRVALERHAQLMLARAERWGPGIRTRDELACVAVLKADFADHRAAMDHLLDTGAVAEAARMVVAVFQFALFQPRPEAYGWAAAVARRIDDALPHAAEVVGAAALGAWYESDIDRSLALGGRALAIAADHGGSTIWARTALVNALGYVQDMEALIRQFTALRDELRATGDPFWQVDSLGYEVIALVMSDRCDAAEVKAQEALAMARRLGNPDCVQWALHALGRALAPVDPDAACAAFEAAMDASRTVESRFNLSLALVEWIGLKRRMGDARNAASGSLDLLEMIAVSGNRSQVSQALREAGLVLAGAGRHEVAALVLMARRDLPQMPKAPHETAEDDATLAAIQGPLPSTRSRLGLRAAAMSEHDLISLCRAELTDVLHTR